MAKKTGRVYVLHDGRVISVIAAYLQKLLLMKDSLYEVEVRKYTSSRTKKQNALYWKWLGIIAEETGHDSNFLHAFFGRELLEPVTVKIAGRAHEVVPSTTSLTTANMAAYMRLIEVFAASELGITLPRPEDREYEKLVAIESQQKAA